MRASGWAFGEPFGSILVASWNHFVSHLGADWKTCNLLEAILLLWIWNSFRRHSETHFANYSAHQRSFVATCWFIVVPFFCSDLVLDRLWFLEIDITPDNVWPQNFKISSKRGFGEFGVIQTELRYLQSEDIRNLGHRLVTQVLGLSVEAPTSGTYQKCFQCPDNLKSCAAAAWASCCRREIFLAPDPALFA